MVCFLQFFLLLLLTRNQSTGPTELLPPTELSCGGRQRLLQPTGVVSRQDLLAFLARAPGEVRTSREILREVWGTAYREEVHVLRVNVARLRQKIEDVASQPRYVLTHVRVGYSLAPSED